MDEQELTTIAQVVRLRGDRLATGLLQEVYRLRQALQDEQERRAKQARNYDQLALAQAHATQHAHKLKAEVRRLQAEVQALEDAYWESPFRE